jgi:hypothetical protein
VARHLAFVDELFGGPAPDLDNAIHVSYLENVFLDLTTDSTVTHVPRFSDRLRAALVGLTIPDQS